MKYNPIPNEWETGWVPDPVWTFLRGKHSPSPSEIRTLELPECMMVSIPTTLSCPFHYCSEILKVKYSAREVAKDLQMKMYIFKSVQ